MLTFFFCFAKNTKLCDVSTWYRICSLYFVLRVAITDFCHEQDLYVLLREKKQTNGVLDMLMVSNSLPLEAAVNCKQLDGMGQWLQESATLK